MRYAGVYLLNIRYPIDKLYTYLIPSDLVDQIVPGLLVVVPFGGGNTRKNAVVVEVFDHTDIQSPKPISGIPSPPFLLSNELCGLCRFMMEQYFCTFGDAVKTILPPGASVRRSVCYFPEDQQPVQGGDLEGLIPQAREILSFIRRNGKAPAASVEAEFGKEGLDCADTLVRLGFAGRDTSYDYRANEKNSQYVKLCLSSDELDDLLADGKAVTPKQASVLRVLAQSPESKVNDVAFLAGVGPSVFKTLEKKELIALYTMPEERTPYDLAQYAAQAGSGDFTLTDQQQAAFAALSALYQEGRPNAALLYGVTGSGKTNVLLSLVDQVLADGKGAIVLVPEIALTSQTVGVFAARYAERIAVYHSGLSAGEKSDAWHRIQDGRASIVIGTRSAIFAPVVNLGLIVLDEEQESTYKSDMTPKYHARDIARFRCAATSSLLVLSSATPSLESYQKAKSGTYTLVTLTERYGGAVLPEVIFADMRSGPANASKERDTLPPAMIGQTLRNELGQVLDKGEQAILFVNRRGYQAFAVCQSCGFVPACPRCSVSLTYHKRPGGTQTEGKMLCHYCGFIADVPASCAKCGKEHIAFMGGGTQMLEEQIAQLFPQAKTMRMDMDTTSGKLSHDKILAAFRNREADILIGTQMVAKGHDFPNVTLVGVISADTSLYLNDFRANEKTFSLLTQIMGRAGRGKAAGRAVIQTYSPENEVLQLAAAQDYDAFYEKEILFRKAYVFPPFCNILAVLFSSEVENALSLCAKSFAKRLDELARGEFADVRLIVFGPFPAGIYKLLGKYRMRILVKCKNTKRTRALFSMLLREFQAGTREVLVSLDMDPSDL